MKDIPDKSIDMILTSPPYDNLRDYKGYTFDFEGIAKELYRVTKDGGVVVWVVGDATIKGSETGTSFKQALYFKEIGFNLHDTMIYRKSNRPPLNHPRYEQEFEYMFVFSKGKPKSTTGEAVSSQLAKIKRLVELTDAEVLAELKAQQELIETADTTQKLNDATEDYLLAVAFGNAKGKDSGALFEMVEALKQLIAGGKLAQRVLAEEFRKKIVELRNEAVETITGGKELMSSADASREADKKGSQLEKVDDFLKDMMTWDWLMSVATAEMFRWLASPTKTMYKPDGGK
jgi:hypothetical protein